MRIGKGEPVMLECTMPNGRTQWLPYDQWQKTGATWTGGITGHRATASTLAAILRQTDRECDPK